MSCYFLQLPNEGEKRCLTWDGYKWDQNDAVCAAVGNNETHVECACTVFSRIKVRELILKAGFCTIEFLFGGFIFVLDRRCHRCNDSQRKKRRLRRRRRQGLIRGAHRCCICRRRCVSRYGHRGRGFLLLPQGQGAGL